MSPLRHVANFLVELKSAAVEVAPIPKDDAVFDLAHRHNLSFYDAAYLELAKREGIPLATLDRQLVRAAVAEGVPLIGA